MAINSIGLLHPGEMGTAVGTALAEQGHKVQWAAAGRSVATKARAEKAGFVDVGSVKALACSSDLIVSICPPDAALDVAQQVGKFDGYYLDASAIAPSTAREIAETVESNGGTYVDGGLIGGPSPDSSLSICLSGPAAKLIADLFDGSRVAVRVGSEDQGAASALKMCYAAWNKGTMALLLDVRALAIAEGVEDALLEEWADSFPEFRQRSVRAAQQAATKGWRWIGEMEEIAHTFNDAGLPDGFHLAAARVFAAPKRDEEATANDSTLKYVLNAIVAQRKCSS